MQNKALKITKIVLNTIFYIIIFFILLFSVANISAGGKDGIPNIFGKGYLTVQSDSMMPTSKDKVKKDSFDKGDLIFVTKLNDKDKLKLKIGDIITFKDTNLRGALNTHRIVDVIKVNGSVTGYITQGDKANALNPYDASKPIEQNSGTTYETASLSAIQAKYNGSWSGAGDTLDWISNPQKGFIIVIILPTIAFLGFEIFLVIRNMMSIKAHKMSLEVEADKEKLKADMESEREAMRAQLLEEMRQQQIKEQELSSEKEGSRDDDDPIVETEINSEDAIRSEDLDVEDTEADLEEEKETDSDENLTEE